MSAAHTGIAELIQLLRNTQSLLDKGVAHATAKGFDPNVLLAARLAPDQWALTRQVQAVCDSAKAAGARLSGTQPPSHPDTEVTYDELRARIAKVVAYLESFDATAFDGALDRDIALPFAPGKLIRGEDYLLQQALPNTVFHVVMAYAILRHNGVPLGKPDFIGHLSFRDA